MTVTFGVQEALAFIVGWFIGTVLLMFGDAVFSLWRMRARIERQFPRMDQPPFWKDFRDTFL